MQRPPENTITIHAEHGLGDKMLAIEGAILLARHLKKRVLINWLSSKEAKCHFGDLFEKTQEMDVIEEPVEFAAGLFRYGLPRVVSRVIIRVFGHSQEKLWQKRVIRWFFLITRWYRKIQMKRRWGFDMVLLPRIKYKDVYDTNKKYVGFPSSMSAFSGKSRIFVLAFHRFFPGPADVTEKYDFLVPRADLLKRVDEIEAQFGKRVIGVHIRRGDIQQNTLLHYARRYTHIDAFIKVMREEIARDEETQFYVATDSARECERLQDVFGERIITQPDIVRSRKSIAGMQSALVDMYALARTHKIIASLSNLSYMAARIGQVERHVMPRTD